MLGRLSILGMLFSFSVFAFHEGFHGVSENSPSIIKQSWDSTYLLRLEGSNGISTGSAFLFHVVRREVVEELYFLTNNHVVNKYCPSVGTCAPLRLIQHGIMDPHSGKLEETEETSVNYGGVEIIKQSRNPDLAIIKVVVLRSGRTPKPLKIASNCYGATTNRLYSIGYPGTNLRTDVNRKSIENQDWTYKRWSEGISTGANLLEGESGTVLLEGTTIDALPGNSGGPVINSRGEVVGVLTGTNKVSGNSYSGIEGASNRAHSYMASCTTVQDFLNLDELNGCY